MCNGIIVVVVDDGTVYAPGSSQVGDFTIKMN